jgi:uncharacterized protein (UPF0332 family)
MQLDFYEPTHPAMGQARVIIITKNNNDKTHSGPAYCFWQKKLQSILLMNDHKGEGYE